MNEKVHHPAFTQPERADISIWRYLAAKKFHWLVQKRRLFMPNAANLGDSLKGMQPKGDKNWWQSIAANAKSIREKPTIEHNHQLISRFAAAFRIRYYVSYWHTNKSVYYKILDINALKNKSISIRTNLAKLRCELPAYVEIGIVKYIDYVVERLPTLNILEYITHKNKIYSHERELRSVALHPVVEGFAQQHYRTHHFQKENDPSFRVFAPPIDVAELIEAVYVHPDSPQSFFEQVESCVKPLRSLNHNEPKGEFRC
jgi:hypothetical protein